MCQRLLNIKVSMTWTSLYFILDKDTLLKQVLHAGLRKDISRRCSSTSVTRQYHMMTRARPSAYLRS